MLVLLRRLFQFFLVISKQGMNLAVRFVADSVNLRSQAPAAKLSDSYRAAPESYRGAPQAEAGPAAADRSQLQIFRKASKFLVDRLRRMNILKLLTRRGLLYRGVLGYGRSGHSEHEHNSIASVKGRFRMDSNLLQHPRRNPQPRL